MARRHRHQRESEGFELILGKYCAKRSTCWKLLEQSFLYISSDVRHFTRAAERLWNLSIGSTVVGICSINGQLRRRSLLKDVLQADSRRTGIHRWLRLRTGKWNRQQTVTRARTVACLIETSSKNMETFFTPEPK